jgi:hypothetical protein
MVRGRLSGLSVPQLLLVGLLLAVVLAVVAAGATSSATFGPFNPGWEGTSDLRAVADDAGASVEVGQSTAVYGEVAPNRTVAVILAPEEPYSSREASRIASFLDAGGRLVIGAESTADANGLLERLDVAARVGDGPLRDERANVNGPALPVADTVEDSPYTAGVDGIVLNVGTRVRPNGATVLARSSEFAYLDANGNGELDPSERVREVPVAVVASKEAGEVVVVGDSSVFINAMLDRSDNRRFAENLLADRSVVLLDVSHTGTIPPLVRGLLGLRDSTVLQALLVGFSVVLGLAVARSRTLEAVREGVTRFGRRRPGSAVERDGGVDPDTLVALLAERHPSWDRERIERVVKETKTDGGKPSADD